MSDYFLAVQDKTEVSKHMETLQALHARVDRMLKAAPAEPAKQTDTTAPPKQAQPTTQAKPAETPTKSDTKETPKKETTEQKPKEESTQENSPSKSEDSTPTKSGGRKKKGKK